MGSARLHEARSPHATNRAETTQADTRTHAPPNTHRHSSMSGRFATYLVENHAKVAGVVLPASVLFGFGYTLAFGTSPLPEGVVPSSTTTAPSTSTTTTNNASAPPLHGFSMRLSLGG